MVALALADLVYGRVLPLIALILARLRVPEGTASLAALAIVLVPIVVASAGLLWRISWGRSSTVPEVGATVEAVETFELPGSPLGLAMVDQRTGYVTFGRGTIERFSLPEGAAGDLVIGPVVGGFEFPRGIAIVGDRLFVIELGRLPCRPAFPICGGRQLAQDVTEGERTIVRSARGRVISFAIATDGSLSDRRTLLDGLPVADSEHAVNGLAVSAEGDLYVSVGWPNALRFETIDTSLTPHPEWMGTILRVDPDSGDVQVHARGFRNVYGIAFDDRGGLWGVDNDGPARNGWRSEELLHIRPDTHYGFPNDGTYRPWSVREDGPARRRRLRHGHRRVGPRALVASVFGFERGTLLRIRFAEAEADPAGRYAGASPTRPARRVASWRRG